MADTAYELLELLEQRQLVAEKTLEKLRKKVDDSKKEVSARKLAKALVDKELITSVQARDLLKTEVESAEVKPDLGTEFSKKVRDQSTSPKTVQESPLNDDDLEIVDPDSDALTEVVEEPLANGELILDGYDHLDKEANRQAAGTRSALDPLAEGFESSGTVSKPHKKIRLVTRRWDSPLVLVGSGALLLISALGVFLFWYLERETAQDMFNLAEEDKTSGRYRSAIGNYEEYLSKYPKDLNVSKARVRIGMCEIWQEVEAKNWKRALEVAQTALVSIQTEEQFGETARPELAGLLSNIVEGFSEQARSSTDGEEQQVFVDLYNKGMKLVDNPAYVPGSMKQTIQPKLDDFSATVAAVRRDIDRDRELAHTIVEIRDFTAANEREKAYKARDELLKIYPALREHSDLQVAIGEISKKQQDAVSVSDEELLATIEDHPAPIHQHVAIASRDGQVADGVGDRVLFVAASGAVYALEAANGKVLWRRFVGYENPLHPIPLTDADSDDALVYDGRHHELLRLEARTKKLVWRFPLNEPALGYKVLGDHLLAVTKTGKLLLVNVRDGASRKQATLPQSLSALPGLEKKRGRLYAVGEHSNLFVLSSNSLQCDEVYYLGQKSGAIVVPPVATLGLVFVSETLNSKVSQLHVLAMENTGLGLHPAQAPFRLEGRVVTAPIVMGRRLLLTTNLGAVYLFEIDKSIEVDPVKKVGETTPTNDVFVRPYAAVANGQFWVGGNRLSRYQLQASRGSITRKEVTHRDDNFIGPLQIMDGTLFSQRRRANRPGITVAAMDIESKARANNAAQVIWETDLAVPLAGEPFDHPDKKIILVNAQAELFELGKEEIAHGLTDRPRQTVNSNDVGILNRRRNLNGGRQIFVSDSHPQFVVLYDPQNGQRQLRRVDLPVESSSLTNPPTVFDGQILLTSDVGPIYLVNPDDGSNLGHPFQPVLGVGQRIQWSSPTVIHSETTQAIVCDGDGKLYRLGATNDQESQLKALAERGIKWSLQRTLSAVEDTVYGVASEETQDLVVTFNLSDLEPGQKWELNARVVWGPEQVGDAVFVATTNDELYCFTVGQSLQWMVPFPHGTLVGRPLEQDGMYYFVAQKGIVWRVAGDTGENGGHFNIGEPLRTGLTAFGSDLVVAGNDGTMYVVKKQVITGDD